MEHTDTSDCGSPSPSQVRLSALVNYITSSLCFSFSLFPLSFLFSRSPLPLFLPFIYLHFLSFSHFSVFILTSPFLSSVMSPFSTRPPFPSFSFIFFHLSSFPPYLIQQTAFSYFALQTGAHQPFVSFDQLLSSTNVSPVDSVMTAPVPSQKHVWPSEEVTLKTLHEELSTASRKVS